MAAARRRNARRATDVLPTARQTGAFAPLSGDKTASRQRYSLQPVILGVQSIVFAVLFQLLVR